jgi:hypothetical protein
VETIAASVRVYGFRGYSHAFQNLLIAGYGIVTPQKVARTSVMKGLNRTATCPVLSIYVSAKERSRPTCTLGDKAATICPRDTPKSNMKRMMRS